ncbi:MAG: hypothetical protein Q4G70_02995 [Pseudomonadota bacterium]|nr:hypothetical protein [Pseudomonadota bacterium]
MAVFTIKLVPFDRDFVPSDEQLQQVESLLRSYCSWNEKEVSFKRFSKLTLVDSGVAFESFKCPLCGTKVDRFGDDDHGEWWADMEDQIEQLETPLLVDLKMPCCGQQALVQQFDFAEKAVFARWVVSVRDYELHSGGGQLDTKQLETLEAAAGGKLIQIVSVG